jgi:glucose-1-phosphate thymidylyltransferase
MTAAETVNEGTVSPNAVIQGKVKIGKGTEIGERVLIRGPVVIGEGCVIKNAYVGPYTAIGNNVEIYNTEIEHCVVFDHVDINCSRRIVDSLIGHNATVFSAQATLPSGHRLIIGDNAVVEV